MKISSRLEGSVCGALKAGSHSALARCNAATTRTVCTATGSRTSTKKPKQDTAETCNRSYLWLRSTFGTSTQDRPRSRCLPRNERRAYSAEAAAAAARKPQPSPRCPTQEKDYLMGFIHGRSEGHVDDYYKFYRDPYQRGYAPPEVQELHISDKPADWQYPSSNDIVDLKDDHHHILEKLYATVARTRRRRSRDLEAIYDLYMQLPEPRMLYLSHRWRAALLRIFGTPPKRDTTSMLRYFALLADVKDAGLTVRRSQWNFAIAFATKYASRVTGQSLESGLQMWRDMEHHANIKANEVTFHTLFDIASKAGNFDLADMIHQEMESRGIVPNRFHHVSSIHYFGLKQDSDGMRAAYKHMVDSGELIDTLALNCLMSGFLRCGEEAAAEAIYEKMKEGQPMAIDMPARSYESNKVMNQVLTMFTKIGKIHPAMKPELQRAIAITPDVHTYKLLVEHYAVRIGDLAKVSKYLDEMRHLKIPIHATIFLALLKGFFQHGGVSGSAWSKKRLDGVLDALYDAKDRGVPGFRIERWLVIWGVRAMKKCSSVVAVEKTFHDMAQRWDIPEENHPFMFDFLDVVVNHWDMKSREGNWSGMSHRRFKKDGSRL